MINVARARKAIEDATDVLHSAANLALIAWVAPGLVAVMLPVRLIAEVLFVASDALDWWESAGGPPNSAG